MREPWARGWEIAAEKWRGVKGGKRRGK